MKKRIAVLTLCRSMEFLQKFIKGMKSAAQDKDTDLFIFAYNKYEENTGFENNTGANIFSLIDYNSFDGVILLSHLFTDLNILEQERRKIIEAKIPAISVNLKLEGLDFLDCNNQDGFRDILDHLIKYHKVTKFTYIGGIESENHAKTRYETFIKILTENNIKIEETSFFLKGDWSYSYGLKIANKIFSSQEALPQAIICANDYIASAILHVAKEKNINIPQQVKLIGYDNLDIAESCHPSLSTVDIHTEQAGYTAVNHLLNPSNHEDLIIKSQSIIRQSCGCENYSDEKQKNAVIDLIDETYQIENFTSHIRQIEDVFLDSTDVYSLLTNLEFYFAGENNYEGNNFSIFLKSDWSSILINTEEELPDNFSFGKQVQSIVNIHEGYKYPNEIIDIKQMIPQNMQSDKSEVFLFMPIFHHTYIHGYYVSKGCTALLNKRYSGLWTRNLGSCIERFRQKNMFKHMSQQFLKLSTHDALSGLLNRIGMEKIGIPYYKKNQAENLTTVLLFADINSMKTINDKFGHLHGDLAVKTVAEAISQVIPKSWCGIRYGGDEFLVIGNEKDFHGENYCKMIAEIIEKRNIAMQLPYKLSASLGFFTVPASTKITLEQAISKVDQAMYIKKQAYHKEHPEGR